MSIDDEKRLKCIEEPDDRLTSDQQELQEALTRCRVAGWHGVFGNAGLKDDLVKIGVIRGVEFKLPELTKKASSDQAYLLALIFPEVPKSIFADFSIYRFLPDCNFVSMTEIHDAARLAGIERQDYAKMEAARLREQSEALLAQKDAASCVTSLYSSGMYLAELRNLVDVVWGVEEDGCSGQAILVIRPLADHSSKRVGWLSLSFGSCSYCDAMEAAEDSAPARREVAQNLVGTAHWYESVMHMHQALETFDYEGLETWVGVRLRRALREKARLLADCPANAHPAPSRLTQ